MSDKDRSIKVKRNWACPPKPRRRWIINPGTRVKESGKIYSRGKLKSELKKTEKEEV